MNGSAIAERELAPGEMLTQNMSISGPEKEGCAATMGEQADAGVPKPSASPKSELRGDWAARRW